MKTKHIALPRLNRLAPTLESTALKLMEEAGELGAAISRMRGINGMAPKPGQDQREAVREVGRELLDVAQTAITMMFVLEEQHGLDIETIFKEHVDKLVRKHYLEAQ